MEPAPSLDLVACHWNEPPQDGCKLVNQVLGKSTHCDPTQLDLADHGRLVTHADSRSSSAILALKAESDRGCFPPRGNLLMDPSLWPNTLDRLCGVVNRSARSLQTILNPRTYLLVHARLTILPESKRQLAGATRQEPIVSPFTSSASPQSNRQPPLRLIRTLVDRIVDRMIA